MKIAVLVKRVPDTASVFEIASDGKSVELSNLKYVMSPYDEHAVEEAMKLKEGQGAQVVVVSAGPPDTKETIRSGLAMGADSGVLVSDAAVEHLTPKGTAQVLAAALKTVEPDLVIAGKQAVDDDASQVPERVAELLDWPHVSVVTRLELDGTTATVDREVEGGQYTYEVPLPAVLSAQKGLNVPRYPTLPNIMKAKRKEIKELALTDLGLAPEDISAAIAVEAMSLPRQERLGRVLEGEPAEQVQTLVKALRDDEKIF